MKAKRIFKHQDGIDCNRLKFKGKILVSNEKRKCVLIGLKSLLIINNKRKYMIIKMITLNSDNFNNNVLKGCLEL